ncbi:MAG: PAS domain-containing protein, partial [Hyphomicrobiaceae bacterium]
MSAGQPPDRSPAISARRPVEHDLLVAALPHPILVLAEEDSIVYANPAAEVFFSASLAVLRRQRLSELIGFGCPLISLVAQVRGSESSVNEYGIEVTMPRFDGPRLVDVHSAPLPEQSGLILL